MLAAYLAGAATLYIISAVVDARRSGRMEDRFLVALGGVVLILCAVAIIGESQ
jgi:hypothetical protein